MCGVILRREKGKAIMTKGGEVMPEVKDWNKHFKQLTKEQRYELWKALDTLLNDKMFDEAWHSDFYTLRTELEYEGI